jgi:sialic acid synthase SpsE
MMISGINPPIVSETSFVASALGASILERYLTLGQAMRGSSQAASLEPGSFERLIQYIRVSEVSLGNGAKKVNGREIPSLKNLRRVVSEQ